MRGAFVNIACKAPKISEAIELIAAELSENCLTLRGFEFIFDTNYLDRAPSDYEAKLIRRLQTYPIQFQNVHYFKPDS